MSTALTLSLDALYLALLVALPALLVAWLVSGGVAFLQSLTKLSEPALNAIPRTLAVALALAMSASWAAVQLFGFTERVLKALPELVH
jgi:flagellar biosynthetic protein FliQ